MAFLFTNFLGCKKQGMGETLDAGVVIKVENAKGDNLLDPTTPGHFKQEDIKIYFLVDGKEKLFYRPNLDNPYGFYIMYGSTVGSVIAIRGNNEDLKHNPTTTYIDWGNGDRDTLVCTWQGDGAHLQIVEAWYNGVKINNRAGAPDTFKVIK